MHKMPLLIALITTALTGCLHHKHSKHKSHGVKSEARGKALYEKFSNEYSKPLPDEKEKVAEPKPEVILEFPNEVIPGERLSPEDELKKNDSTWWFWN